MACHVVLYSINISCYILISSTTPTARDDAPTFHYTVLPPLAVLIGKLDVPPLRSLPAGLLEGFWKDILPRQCLPVAFPTAYRTFLPHSLLPIHHPTFLLPFLTPLHVLFFAPAAVHYAFDCGSVRCGRFTGRLPARAVLRSTAVPHIPHMHAQFARRHHTHLCLPHCARTTTMPPARAPARMVAHTHRSSAFYYRTRTAARTSRSPAALTCARRTPTPIFRYPICLCLLLPLTAAYSWRRTCTALPTIETSHWPTPISYHLYLHTHTHALRPSTACRACPLPPGGT